MSYVRSLVALSIGLAAITFGPSATKALALPNDNRAEAGEDLFEKPPHIAMQSRFWEKVFQKYSDQQVLIHDFDYPEVVIDVIDFNKIAQRFNLKGLTRLQKEFYLQRYMKRYEMALQRFADDQLDAASAGAMEERVYTVYSRNSAALASLFEGHAKLRSQAGLANNFIRAANTAQTYLPDMEQIFSEYGVPARVTRVAFVESMFNTAARSKVGASGIWQLMPTTARMFMNVNHFVDERNSPLKATRAAARLLSSNYKDLQSWPLAITAYNHGASGMQRAQKYVGSSDIQQVILGYQSPSFGFASKNFYAEFLAAANTYDLVLHQGLIATSANRSQLQYVRIPRAMSLAQLVKITKLSPDLLRQHNPCLLPKTFTAYRNKALPSQYEIALPRAVAIKARMALAGSKARSLAGNEVMR